MAELVSTALAGITLFIVTNIDDVFVLVGFFADRTVRARNIVIGQFLGIYALVAVSILAAQLSLVVPLPYVGLLGLIPIALGIRKLMERDDDDDETAPSSGFGWQQVMTIAGVTIANGGDNIGVYTPVFAMRTAQDVALITIVFGVMTVLWCVASHWLVNHPTIGAPIRRYAHRVLPFALIAIGCWVLVEADSVSLVR